MTRKQSSIFAESWCGTQLLLLPWQHQPQLHLLGRNRADWPSPTTLQPSLAQRSASLSIKVSVQMDQPLPESCMHALELWWQHTRTRDRVPSCRMLRHMVADHWGSSSAAHPLSWHTVRLSGHVLLLPSPPAAVTEDPATSRS